MNPDPQSPGQRAPREGRRRAPPGPDGDAEPVGLRVLVVEDNATNRELAVYLLSRRGHIVQTSNSGEDALAMLRSQPFDVVLMDVQMPDMDGIQTTRAIRRREHPGGKRVPIIAMTARAMRGDRERCLRAGMDDYIAKPIDVEELYATLDRLGSPPDDADDTAYAVAGDALVLDPRDVLLRLRGHERLYHRVARVFLDEADALLSAIEQAVARDSASEVLAAAHRLKGAVSNVGGLRVEALALEMERAAERGEVEPARERLSEMRKELTALNAALEARFAGGSG